MGIKPKKKHPENCLEYHTKAEVAERFDVTERTVYNWIRKKILRATKFGLVRCDWIREDILAPDESSKAS